MERLYLNNDWYFNDTFAEGMEKTDYNFEEGEKVRIPHTIAETPLHYFDESIYQKIAAYHKTFNVPASWMGKDVYLTFEGVGHSFVVYINGKIAGEHFCGNWLHARNSSSPCRKLSWSFCNHAFGREGVPRN